MKKNVSLHTRGCAAAAAVENVAEKKSRDKLWEQWDKAQNTLNQHSSESLMPENLNAAVQQLIFLSIVKQFSEENLLQSFSLRARNMKKKKFSFPNWPPDRRSVRFQYSEKVIFAKRVLQLNYYVAVFWVSKKAKQFFYGVICWREKEIERVFNLHELLKLHGKFIWCGKLLHNFSCPYGKGI